MTTVDEAREALQAAIVTDATARQVIEAIDAFEAAVRADYEAKLAALRDDERLGDALHSAVHPGHPWSGCGEPDWVYKHLIPRFRAAIDALREGADKPS